jgi:uncharacterized RDD family membrane protein YckC
MLGVTMPNDTIDPGGFEPRDPTKVLVRRYLAYLVDFLVITLVAVLALSFTAESNTLDELSDTLGLEGDQRLEPNDVKRYQEDDGIYVFYFRDVPVLEDQVGVLTIEQKDLQTVFLVTAAAWILLYVGLQGFTGATIGKGAAGIRTVKKTGDPPGILRALVRSILLPIDSLPSAPFLPLVGTIFAVTTDGHKRLGDLVGGTYVVDKDAVGRAVRPDDDATALPLHQPEQQPWSEPDVAAAPLAPAAVAPFAGSADAGVADPNAPAWAQPATIAPGQVDDWTSEQPVPVAGTDPWAPAAGAGTAASDWERVIAEEQSQVDAEPQAQPAATSTGGGASIDDYEPQWDEARKSYIQWDPRRDEWLQFSDALQQWHPIDRPPTT